MSFLLLPSRTDHLRGHSKKVQKPRSNRLRLESRFSHRVVNYWNSLPEHVISAPSVNIFKMRSIDLLSLLLKTEYCVTSEGRTHFKMNLFKPLIIKPNVSGLINSLCSKMRLLSIPPLIPSEILYQREITPAKTPAHHNNSEIEKLLKSELCDYPAYSSRKSKFRHCYLFPHSSSWISGCYHDS
ncbi:unnamed protein product [Schistosoma haematobium]|nr:unnamed protein product [Schistosoma haematobium]